MIQENFSIEHIPHSAGVYMFCDRKKSILYIGKAKNLQKRVGQYFSPGSVRKQEMMQHAHNVSFITTSSESDALLLEESLIKEHQPLYNRLLKNNSTYVYIKITQETYPQIFIVRQRKNDKAIYIGPKHSSLTLRKLLQYCKEYFGWRGCRNQQFHQGKLCSQYHFGTCKGRCVSKKLLASPTPISGFPLYENITPELYKTITTTIQKFFAGKTQELKDKIYNDIQSCIETQNFEWANYLKEIYINIDGFVERHSVILTHPHTCTYARIQRVESRYIIILIKVVDGKIVDIIREKKAIDEFDRSSILFSIQEERGIGKAYVSVLDTNNTYEILDTTDRDTIGYDTIHWFYSKDKNISIQKTIKELSPTTEHSIQSYIKSEAFMTNSIVESLLHRIQKTYVLKNFPYRIECIDISHLSGGRVSGGLSCYVGGIPYKKGYRQYKIGKYIDKNIINDYEQLKEVCIRRFKLKKNSDQIASDIIPELPDLFIIDGGIGQLGILRSLIKDFPAMQKIIEKISIVSLGKGDARKTTNIGSISKKNNTYIAEKIYKRDQQRGIVEKDLSYDESDKLLVQIRNEAHRFANKYRKKQMSDEWKV